MEQEGNTLSVTATSAVELYAELHVVDLRGMSHEQKLVEVREGTSKLWIDTRDFASGSYLLILRTDHQTISRKFEIIR